MKTFTAVFIIAVISTCNIGVDAFSFNLSGGFNPGISFGRTALQQRYQINSQHDDEIDWPQPQYVHNYHVPEYNSSSVIDGIESEDNENPQTHHYGSHQRHHRH